MARPRRPRRVALVLTGVDAYSRRIAEGIGRYAHSHDPWEFFLRLGGPQDHGAIVSRQIDGVIGNLIDERLADALRKARIPAVYTSNRRPHLPLPRVIVDDAGVARLAFEHLAGFGLRSFGYVGHVDPAHGGSRLRDETFRRAAARAGGTCQSYVRPRSGRQEASWEEQLESLGRWIAGLPKPAGLFAFADDEVWLAAQACRHLNIDVPDQVALLGATNDEMVCNLATPPLSSIALPLEQLGFKAAGLLDRLMRGARPPKDPTVLPPMHVVARRSTDVLAIEDEDVRGALRFIRDHADRLDRVADVAAAVAVSKRTLQRNFNAALGRTVQQEIQRCRLERGRRILLETDLPIPQVASRCGFTYAHYFGRVFRKATGQSPSQFRNAHRLR